MHLCESAGEFFTPRNLQMIRNTVTETELIAFLQTRNKKKAAKLCWFVCKNPSQHYNSVIRNPKWTNLSQTPLRLEGFWCLPPSSFFLASPGSTWTSWRMSGRLVTTPVPRGSRSLPTRLSSTELLPLLWRQDAQMKVPVRWALHQGLRLLSGWTHQGFTPAMLDLGYSQHREHYFPQAGACFIADSSSCLDGALRIAFGWRGSK